MGDYAVWDGSMNTRTAEAKRTHRDFPFDDTTLDVLIKRAAAVIPDDLPAQIMIATLAIAAQPDDPIAALDRALERRLAGAAS